MRKGGLLLTLVGALLACTLAVPGAAWAVSTRPDIVEAKSSYMVDEMGHELWSENADTKMAPASITKIMTAMVALDAGISMDKVITCQDVALSENAQAAAYQTGSTVTFGDLMEVMLVFSANDAAGQVAIAVAGSETAFAKLMNEKAEQLGMTNTHFVNVHGLDADNHYSTARDLVTMGRYAMLNYPYIRKMVKTRAVTVNVNGTAMSFDSTDDLMETYQGLLGIKTGVSDTGTTFLGASKREGVMLFTCVLGCETHEGRFDDTAALMDWAYDTYQTTEFANPNNVLDPVPFAFHFGWVCPVTSDGFASGVSWPDGGATVYTRMTSTDNVAIPGDSYGSSVWKQDGRVVAAISYSAGDVEADKPWFGPFNWPMFPAFTRGDAA